MSSYSEHALDEDEVIHTDIESVEERVRTSLCIEKLSFAQVKTFSEIGLSSMLHGLEIKCQNGTKYYLSIIKVC